MPEVWACGAPPAAREWGRSRCFLGFLSHPFFAPRPTTPPQAVRCRLRWRIEHHVRWCFDRATQRGEPCRTSSRLVRPLSSCRLGCASLANRTAQSSRTSVCGRGPPAFFSARARPQLVLPCRRGCGRWAWGSWVAVETACVSLAFSARHFRHFFDGIFLSPGCAPPAQPSVARHAAPLARHWTARYVPAFWSGGAEDPPRPPGLQPRCLRICACVWATRTRQRRRAEGNVAFSSECPGFLRCARCAVTSKSAAKLLRSGCCLSPPGFE